MDDYARRKLAPVKRYIGAKLTGARLQGVDESSEPDLLILSFTDLPDLEIGVWHGIGASGFDIEAAETGEMSRSDGLGS